MNRTIWNTRFTQLQARRAIEATLGERVADLQAGIQVALVYERSYLRERFDNRGLVHEFTIAGYTPSGHYMTHAAVRDAQLVRIIIQPLRK